jgi:hypothetical protein
MPMTQRDKFRLAILVGLMVALMGLVVYARWGTRKPSHDFSESVIVKQRVINLNK